MSTNKQATIRFFTLDRCFSNHHKKYFIEDLIEACNLELFELTGINNGVKKRQLFNDISYMESDQGWSINLLRLREGKRVYYRYEDKDFSIKHVGISNLELRKINDVLSIVDRFNGLPGFDWIEATKSSLEKNYALKNDESFIFFEQNDFLKGIHFFGILVNYIKNKIAIEITYKGFKNDFQISKIIHPWFLKQYNNRWFVFGWSEEFNSLSNFALDRIISIKESNVKYIQNSLIDVKEYFEDVVGVTVFKDKEIEKIIIKCKKEHWNYIENKPLHGSQRVIKRTDDTIEFELELIINYELISLLFSHLDKLEIIEPKSLRKQIYEISNAICEKHI